MIVKCDHCHHEAQAMVAGGYCEWCHRGTKQPLADDYMSKMTDEKHEPTCPTCKSGNDPWTITKGELSYLCVDWWHPECRLPATEQAELKIGRIHDRDCQCRDNSYSICEGLRAAVNRALDERKPHMFCPNCGNVQPLTAAEKRAGGGN